MSFHGIKLDYYAILNVPKTATKEAVAKAYHEKLKKYEIAKRDAEIEKNKDKIQEAILQLEIVSKCAKLLKESSRAEYDIAYDIKDDDDGDIFNSFKDKYNAFVDVEKQKWDELISKQGGKYVPSQETVDYIKTTKPEKLSEGDMSVLLADRQKKLELQDIEFALDETIAQNYLKDLGTGGVLGKKFHEDFDKMKREEFLRKGSKQNKEIISFNELDMGCGVEIDSIGCDGPCDLTSGYTLGYIHNNFTSDADFDNGMSIEERLQQRIRERDQISVPKEKPTSAGAFDRFSISNQLGFIVGNSFEGQETSHSVNKTGDERKAYLAMIESNKKK